MASVWNPGQYEKFRGERSQPFYDLLSLVRPIPGGRAIDLGCGTGQLTSALHETTKAKETLGIDSADTMLAQSAEFAGAGLEFQRLEIEDLPVGATYDLVFSNAAIQWIDDHETLLTRLAGNVADGGQLAIQMPANDDHPSHQTAFELAGEEPWATHLAGYRRIWPVLPPEQYASLLHRLGFDEQHVRLQVYPHSLESSAAVVEWVRGTLLTDYQKRMSSEAFEGFLQAYRARLLPQLEDQSPFFYAFKRVLLWGLRTPAHV